MHCLNNRACCHGSNALPFTSFLTPLLRSRRSRSTLSFPLASPVRVVPHSLTFRVVPHVVSAPHALPRACQLARDHGASSSCSCCSGVRVAAGGAALVGCGGHGRASGRHGTHDGDPLLDGFIRRVVAARRLQRHRSDAHWRFRLRPRRLRQKKSARTRTTEARWLSAATLLQLTGSRPTALRCGIRRTGCSARSQEGTARPSGGEACAPLGTFRPCTFGTASFTSAAGSATSMRSRRTTSRPGTVSRRGL